MALEKELKKYDEVRPSLLDRKGDWVVIFGDDVVGIFNDYEDALRAGYGVAKLEPFLVKKIEQDETVHHFSRDIGAAVCRT